MASDGGAPLRASSRQVTGLSVLSQDLVRYRDDP
jgi:hypothetical protein